MWKLYRKTLFKKFYGGTKIWKMNIALQTSVFLLGTYISVCYFLNRFAAKVEAEEYFIRTSWADNPDDEALTMDWNDDSGKPVLARQVEPETAHGLWDNQREPSTVRPAPIAQIKGEKSLQVRLLCLLFQPCRIHYRNPATHGLSKLNEAHFAIRAIWGLALKDSSSTGDAALIFPWTTCKSAKIFSAFFAFSSRWYKTLRLISIRLRFFHYIFYIWSGRCSVFSASFNYPSSTFENGANDMTFH